MSTFLKPLLLQGLAASIRVSTEVHDLQSAEGMMQEIFRQVFGMSATPLDYIKLAFNVTLASLIFRAAAHMGAGRSTWSAKRFWLVALSGLLANIAMLNLGYALDEYYRSLCRHQFAILTVAAGTVTFLALIPSLIAWLLGRSIRPTADTPPPAPADAE
ncbi:hypothetical protein [Prosthecobacter sp.]|uniref:hypothetical protein n=1 Tax=Prosthecobacter sp. TaxID=1965333 RepID=UPI003784F706